MQQAAPQEIRRLPPRLVSPSHLWSGLVEAYFSFSGEAPSLILPTGGVDLLFVRSSAGNDSLPSIMIHGHVSEGFAPPRMYLSGIGIRFRPGGFTALTRIPQHEVTGGLFDFTELVDRHLLQRLRKYSAGERGGYRPEAMERVVQEMASKGDPGPSWLMELNGLWLRRPTIDLGALASGAGISMRQLERLGPNYFGTAPKKLTRVLRLRRCLRLKIAGFSWIDAALDSGYADQAHLSRECRSILGVSPTAFLHLWRNREVFRL